MQKGGSAVTVGYFYLGTTQPTAENYQTLPGAVSSYTSIDEAVGAVTSVAAGETVYMLCPTKWMEEKNVALEDNDQNSFDFLEEKDVTTISGYTIYKTQVFDHSSTVTLKTIPRCTTARHATIIVNYKKERKMGSIKIEELMEEKRISLIQKATNSLNRLTETMKGLVEEVERVKGVVEEK